MKILYTTDLHGRDLYYTITYKKALEHEVDMIINGGDMLPKVEPVFERQKKYLKFFEKRYFKQLEKAQIHYGAFRRIPRCTHM